MVVGAFDLPRVRSLAEQFLEWGVTCIKVKTGLMPEEDVDEISAAGEFDRDDLGH